MLHHHDTYAAVLLLQLDKFARPSEMGIDSSQSRKKRETGTQGDTVLLDPVDTVGTMPLNCWRMSWKLRGTLKTVFFQVHLYNRV